MIDPRWEITRLRTKLMMDGYPEKTADRICDQAAAEIDSRLLIILQSAVQEAVAAGIDMGADKIVEDIGIGQTGGTYHLTTFSGSADYSEPPLPMLGRILATAKTAKDGSRYKIVPVGAKSKPRSVHSMMDAMQHISNQAEAAVNNASSDNDIDSMPSARAFSSSFPLNSPKKMEVKPTDKRAPEFRTATSKQDPATKWVLPAKDLNMNGMIMDINTRMQSAIVEMVDSVIKKYGG